MYNNETQLISCTKAAARTIIISNRLVFGYCDKYI